MYNSVKKSKMEQTELSKCTLDHRYHNHGTWTVCCLSTCNFVDNFSKINTFYNMYTYIIIRYFIKLKGRKGTIPFKKE